MAYDFDEYGDPWPDYYGANIDTVAQDSDYIDNGDGTYTQISTGDVWEDGQVIGYDYGDGTWEDLDGNLYDPFGNIITAYGDAPQNSEPVPAFEFDDATGLFWDPVTGGWFTQDAQAVSDPYANVALDDPTVVLPPFYVGEVRDPVNLDDYGNPGAAPKSGNWLTNFLGSLLGGSGGGGGGGGGGGSTSSSTKQQADQRAQQAQQQLQQAQQQGAGAAQIQALQRQLALAQAAANKAGGIDTKTILIAAATGLGVYALATRRSQNPSRRRRIASRK